MECGRTGLSMRDSKRALRVISPSRGASSLSAAWRPRSALARDLGVLDSSHKQHIPSVAA
jgi:hypothetical protein